jgi:hypothetical protein
MRTRKEKAKRNVHQQGQDAREVHPGEGLACHGRQYEEGHATKKRLSRRRVNKILGDVHGAGGRPKLPRLLEHRQGTSRADPPASRRNLMAMQQSRMPCVEWEGPSLHCREAGGYQNSPNQQRKVPSAVEGSPDRVGAWRNVQVEWKARNAVNMFPCMNRGNQNDKGKKFRPAANTPPGSFSTSATRSRRRTYSAQGMAPPTSPRADHGEL